MSCCLLQEKIVKIVNRGDGELRDGKTNREMAADTKMSTSLIVAITSDDWYTSSLIFYNEQIRGTKY